MFTAIEQMKVRQEKQQKTLDAILKIVQGLCLGAVITEDSESLPEEVRLRLKTSEELDHLEGLLDDKKVFAYVIRVMFCVG